MDLELQLGVILNLRQTLPLDWPQSSRLAIEYRLQSAKIFNDKAIHLNTTPAIWSDDDVVNDAYFSNHSRLITCNKAAMIR